MQEQRSEPLRNRLYLLRFNPVARAMFANNEPLIDWETVSQEGQQVYIDFSREQSDDAREFKFFWVFQSLLEYFRFRGHQGREFPPLCVVIDELTFLVRGTQLNKDVIIEDFRMFTQVYRRNANISFIGATQEQAELPDDMLRASLQLGNLLFGATAEMETARQRAERFEPMNPWEVKHVEYREKFSRDGGPTVDKQITFMPFDEQMYIASQKYQSLFQGEGLYARVSREGEFPRSTQRIAITGLAEKVAADNKFVWWYRKYLMQRDGIIVQTQRSLPSPKLAAAQTPPPQVGKSSDPVRDSIAQASEAWEQIREEEKQPSHEGVLSGKSRKPKKPHTPGHDLSKPGTSKRFGRRE